MLDDKLKRKRLELRKATQEEERLKAKRSITQNIKSIDDLNSKILKITINQYHNDGFPENLLEQYNKLVKLAKLSEQEVRFAGVHDYFDKEILLKLQKERLNE